MLSFWVWSAVDIARFAGLRRDLVVRDFDFVVLRVEMERVDLELRRVFAERFGMGFTLFIRSIGLMFTSGSSID